MTDDTCFMRKQTGPWWNRSRTVDTVVCGLDQAGRYYQQGFRFDWEAMQRNRDREAVAAKRLKENEK